MENKTRVSFYALIQNKEGKYLFIKRSENDSWPGVWEIPGGKPEDDEDISDTLIRETWEEVGLKIEPLSPFHVIHNASPDKKMERLIFRAILMEDDKVKLSKEHSAYKWSDFSDPEILESSFLQKVKESLFS
jgi:8-oxo-dGTP pyrophosphatase MutT (NUDIX family)